MTVEKGPGVTYIWYDVPENALENIEPWTEVAKKIREITSDVMDLAISMAPVGGARLDNQFAQIKFSHYKAAGIGKVGKRYQQVVGNRAPHAYWVHEGTGGGGDRRGTKGIVKVSGYGMGPVLLGLGTREVGLSPGTREGVKRWSPETGAQWKAFPSAVMFKKYRWRGQEPQPWLAEAGQAAYRLPGNH